MKRIWILVAVLIGTMTLAITGCSQGAASPSATNAPASPATQTAPSSPATAAPTQVPAKKVDFPVKGKPITIIIPFSAGGVGDLAGRMLATQLEKELGTPVEIVNKPGASTQTGMTELVRAKPDGYTLGETPFASVFVTYLDKSRGAVYTREDFQPVSNFVSIDNILFAKSNGKYKTVKDVVEAAKANPGKVTVGVTGILGNTHLVALGLAELTGVDVSYVTFNGGGEVLTALMGDHLEVGSGSAGDVVSQYKGGSVVVLGTTGSRQSPFFPDAKTFTDQGFPLVNTYSIGLSAPKGTPKEIVDILSNAVKKATDSPELKARFADMAMQPDYLGSEEYKKFWQDAEGRIKPLVEKVKSSKK